MHDQARVLRGLMERQGEPAPIEGEASPAATQTIAVTSGKGGVGKSCIALNLAIALQRMGRSVCLLDLNFGLGNIDLLCGLNGYWNFAHVLSGARTIAEIILEGPAGLHVVPGASGLLDLLDGSPGVHREIIAQLDRLERAHDYLVLDTGTGMHRAVRQLVSAADTVLVVTTPEPTAIADAYATLKALTTGFVSGLPHVLVNQADSPEQAREIIARVQQTARTFLSVTVASAGFIPRDPAVAQAVHERRPFVEQLPRRPASRAIEQLARRVVQLVPDDPERPSFFARFGR